MKKILTSFVFILAFGAYGAYRVLGDSNNVAYVAPQTVSSSQTTGTTVASSPSPLSTPPNTPTSAQTPISTPTPTPAPTPAQQPLPSPVSVPVPTPVVAAKPKGQYTDGTYTGSVANAYYGNVQVQVTVSGGRITDIAFLQYPSDRSTSLRISNMAMPALKTEAIQSQNAQVNTVSGATEISGAFRQSLASALSQAQG